MNDKYLNPDWNEGGRIHNWRLYVSEELRAIWHTFTDDQKIAIGKSADDNASREEWD